MTHDFLRNVFEFIYKKNVIETKRRIKNDKKNIFSWTHQSFNFFIYSGQQTCVEVYLIKFHDE